MAKKITKPPDKWAVLTVEAVSSEMRVRVPICGREVTRDDTHRELALQRLVHNGVETCREQADVEVAIAVDGVETERRVLCGFCYDSIRSAIWPTINLVRTNDRIVVKIPEGLLHAGKNSDR